MSHHELCPCHGVKAYNNEALNDLTRRACQCELIAKVRADERAKVEAYYTNPCMSCGPMSEWSTYVCDECIKEYGQEFGGEQE